MQPCTPKTEGKNELPEMGRAIGQLVTENSAEIRKARYHLISATTHFTKRKQTIEYTHANADPQPQAPRGFFFGTGIFEVYHSHNDANQRNQNGGDTDADFHLCGDRRTTRA